MEQKYEVKKLRENAMYLQKAAQWFHQKWDIALEEYQKSIQMCIIKNKKIPQWYIVINEKEDIIAGAGVIENDFHNRKDLTPNVCALFVEEQYRKRGIAKHVLDFIKQDLKELGLKEIYLVTDHTQFYEKCGWEFLTMVMGEDNLPERMYVTKI
ncbi:MAG TPA: GNAT family N-acetyltransferase [Candidatus Coprocola pullicola]|nr:GNAT family N-acetyltransferase [Candidatus Coprocola pullicola]